MGVEFVRLAVQAREEWHRTFDSLMLFALRPQELLRMSGGVDHIYINGDASGSETLGGSIVAAVDLDALTWHAEHMDTYAGSTGWVCGATGTDGLTAKDFIDYVKELVALAALVMQHGHRWTNKIVCAVWDNKSVVRAIDTASFVTCWPLSPGWRFCTSLP